MMNLVAWSLAHNEPQGISASSLGRTSVATACILAGDYDSAYHSISLDADKRYHRYALYARRPIHHSKTTFAFGRRDTSWKVNSAVNMCKRYRYTMPLHFTRYSVITTFPLMITFIHLSN